MEKNAFQTPPRGLCGGFSFCLCSFRWRRPPFFGGVMYPAAFLRPSTAAFLLLADFRWQRCVPGWAFRARQWRLAFEKSPHFRFYRLFVSREANVSRETSEQDGTQSFLREKQRFLHETALAALSAASSVAWCSKKPLRLRIGRQFLAISARLYALRAASAGFSLKRGECFT